MSAAQHASVQAAIWKVKNSEYSQRPKVKRKKHKQQDNNPDKVHETWNNRGWFLYFPPNSPLFGTVQSADFGPKKDLEEELRAFGVVWEP